MLYFITEKIAAVIALTGLVLFDLLGLAYAWERKDIQRFIINLITSLIINLLLYGLEQQKYTTYLVLTYTPIDDQYK